MSDSLVKLLNVQMRQRRLREQHSSARERLVSAYRMRLYRLHTSRARLDMCSDIAFREASYRYKEHRPFVLLQKTYTVRKCGLPLHDILSRRREL